MPLMLTLRAHHGKVDRLRASRRRPPRRPGLSVWRLEDRTLLSSAVGAVAATPAVTFDMPVSNVAVTTDPGVQQSPSIAVDPLDANHLATAYMDRSLVTTGYAGIGVAVSFNDGATWQHSSVPLPAGFNQGASNPTLVFDDQGNAFVSYEAATFLGPQPPLTNPTTIDPVTQERTRTYGFQANNGIFVVRSDDGGLTWGTPVAVASHLYTTTPVPFEINADLAIDLYHTLPGGQPNPYYGEMYVTWARYYPAGDFPGEPGSGGGSDIMFSVSHDGGQTWQTQLTTNPLNGASISVIWKTGNTGTGAPAGLGYQNNAHLSIGPEGDIYVDSLFGGTVAVNMSSDGGQNFTTPNDSTGQGEAFGLGNDLFGADSSGLPTNSFRTVPQRDVAADPTRPGDVYVADVSSSFDAAGNLVDPGDIYFARSTDDGQTWQTSFKIGTMPAQVLNDDNGGQIDTGQPGQVTSADALVQMATDSNGDIVVIWYDTRRDPANHLLDVYGTVSHDGGLTFSPNFRITTTSFDANLGEFTDATGQPDYYLGDSLGLSVANGIAYAAWTDTRAGNQNIEFASFPIDPPPAPLTDRFDPDSSPATATNLGSVIRTSLPQLAVAVGDQDWFRFQAAATGELTIQANAGLAGSVPTLELVDASGSTVLASGVDQFDDQGRLIGEQIEFAGVAGQTYLVHLTPSGGSGDVAYSLDVQSLTADLGTQVEADAGGILAPGDQAYDLISAGVSGSMEVSLVAAADLQGSLQLEVLDPNTLAVLATGSGQDGTEQTSVVVTQGQELLVHVFGAAATTGHYLLDMVNLDQYQTPDNASLLFPAGAGPSEVALADLSGNGIMDAVVSSALSNTVGVLLGNGDGTFQAPRQYAVGSFIAGGLDSLAGLPNFGRSGHRGPHQQRHPRHHRRQPRLGRHLGTSGPGRRHVRAAAPL